MTTLMALKVPSTQLITKDDALVNFVEHGIIMAADTRFIRISDKMPFLKDGLKVGGLSRYVLAGYSGDVTLAYNGLASAQAVLARQGGSPDIIADIVRNQLIDAQTKITKNRQPEPTSILLGIWLFENPVLFRLESSNGFEPRECNGPEFAGHGGKELQRVFLDNLNSIPIGFQQRDKENAKLLGLPYDPNKPIEVRLLDLALQAGLSVDQVNEIYRQRGAPEVGGKVQVFVITSDGIRKVGYSTLDIAGGRDTLEHRTPNKLFRPHEMGIEGSAKTSNGKLLELKKKRVRKRKNKR